MLHVGSTAPPFELPDARMEMIQLSSFRGKKNVVLYFYPRDGTPVCTREAIEFSDNEEEFSECDTVVMGVSRDDWMVHEEFCDKHGISVRLLSDTDCEVSRKYEVMMEHSGNGADGTNGAGDSASGNGDAYGAKREGIRRCTFIIDKKGVVRHILHDMNPREHVGNVLGLVRQIHGH
jgi:thioredoxin-dependent peroxiredoxin